MLIAVIVLGAIALVAAAVLFVCSKKFAVKEDPRIAQVSAVLPQANCGGCGFPGCSGMADALVKAADGGSLDGLNCPVGGAGGSLQGKYTTFTASNSSTSYAIQLTNVGVSLYVDLNSDRSHLNDAPYDMFCIPFSDT